MTKKFQNNQSRPQNPIQTDITDFDLLQNGDFVWMGHSFIMMKQNNQIIVTDPICFDIQKIIKKFKYSNEINLKQLPKIDVCVITHDHYDHLDINTLKQINITTLICPLKVSQYLQFLTCQKHELDWFQSITINLNTFTLIPSRHYSNRLGSKFQTLWGGYIINNYLISGDGSYSQDIIEQIKQFLQENNIQLEIMFIECGQYSQEWPDNHMQPAQSKEYFNQLGGRLMVPIHFGMFCLSYHRWNDVLQVADDKTLIARIGKIYSSAATAEVDQAWVE